jgi:hypothetical protein
MTAGIQERPQRTQDRKFVFHIVQLASGRGCVRAEADPDFLLLGLIITPRTQMWLPFIQREGFSGERCLDFDESEARSYIFLPDIGPV